LIRSRKRTFNEVPGPNREDCPCSEDT